MASPPLVRSRSDRMIAGVAGGLGERFGIDPTLIRIVFVLTIFFGGFGAFAYVVLWILLPSSTTESATAMRIAEQRYARGEITRDEFLELREVLSRAADGGP